MHSALSVANAFLSLAKEEGKNLTNMQVQKLVFFAHGVHLGAYNQPLITEKVKAWTFGPVIPPLYNKLRGYGNGHVTSLIELDAEEHDDVRSHPKANAVINSVWQKYGGYTGSKLSAISHAQGSPWDTVWNSPGGEFAVIPDSVIRDYYSPRVTKRVQS